MSTPKASLTRQRVRSGCYTCKIRKVKCRSENQNNQDGSDEQSGCDCCRRLGLQCRWTAPSANEEYTPPPKRRQTIGRRRARQTGSTSRSKSRDTTQPTEPQDTMAQIIPLTQFDAHGESSSKTSPFELDACVDMLGDLPFDLDFDLDINPVDLNFNGEGLDFAQLPTAGSSLPPPGTLATHPNFTGDIPRTAGHSDYSHISVDGVPSVINPAESTTLGTKEQQLIQHYLATMTGYAKIDEGTAGANNLYTTAFSQSLSFKPLLYAILAYSESHLALESSGCFENASQYDRLAHQSFEACYNNTSEPENLLLTLFIRAKRIHLLAGDIESFHSLISQAAEIVLSEEGRRALKDPFSLAQRIVIRLSLLDARASCYRLGGGKLIRALRSIPAMSFIFDQDGNAETTSNAVVSLLRADILRMKVAELDLRLKFQNDSEQVISYPVRTEEVRSLQRHIEHEIRQWEYQISCRGHDLDAISTVESILEASIYAQYLVMAALHSANLYLYLLYPLKPIQWEHSVSRVLHCQLRLQQDPSRSNSPSSLIPSSLFLAALCTKDPIHRDWILGRLKMGEKWGTYVKRTREVLESITKIRPLDDELDVCSLMDHSHGRFLI